MEFNSGFKGLSAYWNSGNNTRLIVGSGFVLESYWLWVLCFMSWCKLTLLIPAVTVTNRYH